MIDLSKPILFEDAVSGGFLTEKHIEKEAKLAAGLFDRFYVYAGDTVSLLLSNLVNLFVFFAGAERVGAKIHLPETRLHWKQIFSSLDFERPKILVVEEKFVWDFAQSRPSELLEALHLNLPGIEVIVVADDRNSEGKEKGAGFLRSYSWKTLKKFVDPLESERHVSSLMIVCGSRKIDKAKAGFIWRRNEKGFYYLDFLGDNG